MQATDLDWRWLRPSGICSYISVTYAFASAEYNTISIFTMTKEAENCDKIFVNFLWSIL